MTADNISLLLAFVAGVLSTLSPCVLPVLTFVTASSLNKSKFGPIALSAGILVTFVGGSLVLQATGSILGVGASILRPIAGLFLTLSGLLFVSDTISGLFAGLFSSTLSHIPSPSGTDARYPLVSEFINGFFLGIVWTPCSGPSLGAAFGLAGQTGQLSKAFLIILVFGAGSIIPLVIFAYGARSLTQTIRQQTRVLLTLKKLFGALMMLFGLSIIIGYDRYVESLLLELTPETWLGFITRY
ncbi:Cytochrome C biogenesis protein transmembrane region [Trichlorobacter thiogenes]|uniref:Cytochrome C biogenesis protein transmembrane region n=1 Tax=Trichlorobacter thiogenes TaxID=115783 RepID=A0A1T4S5B5_9BACT|nr:cytochrome c biogenesis CcdA family protein [Trichlorobacter thiogenes]SKA23414.1 Cytochrome C biogenesis protein transmembrane region [Trichlorobacter thiogenes]